MLSLETIFSPNQQRRFVQRSAVFLPRVLYPGMRFLQVTEHHIPEDSNLPYLLIIALFDIFSALLTLLLNLS